jgi:hypothetical protein
MSRRYSPEDQEFALQRVVANRGDIARTAKELNISVATLYRWQESRMDSQFSLSSLSSNFSEPDSPAAADSKSLSVHGEAAEGIREGLPPDDLQALRDLKSKMLDLTNYIAAGNEIKKAIDAAPLNQRIAALVQLIDRIIKLAAELPAPPERSLLEQLLDEGDAEDEDDEGDFSETPYRPEPNY